MMDDSQMKELMNDPEFTNRLDKANTVDDLESLFSQYHVSISRSEIEKMIAMLNSSEELSDGELESVSGGTIVNWFIRYILQRRAALGYGGSSYGTGGSGGGGGGGVGF